VGTEEECEAAFKRAAEVTDRTVLIECIIKPDDCSGSAGCCGLMLLAGWIAYVRSRALPGQASMLWPAAMSLDCPSSGWLLSIACAAGTSALALTAVEVLQLGKLMMNANSKA
jgi:hypothetical protein